MTLKYEHVGFDEAGRPQFTVTSDSEAPHFVLTGPDASGEVVTDDGSRYDVSPPVIEAETHRHAIDIAHGIGREHEVRGTFEATDPGWRYDATDPELDRDLKSIAKQEG